MAITTPGPNNTEIELEVQPLSKYSSKWASKTQFETIRRQIFSVYSNQEQRNFKPKKSDYQKTTTIQKP